MSQSTLNPLLVAGLKRIHLEMIAEPTQYYINLLSKWNSTYNLTAIRDIDSMVNKHLLDSLAILPWIHGAHIIDVGTGAGLPGIPLAIANPLKQFTLLDSNGKKTRFLTEVKRQLDLKNIEIVQSRVENYQPEVTFDTVISRAFSSLDQMIHWTKHLIHDQGIWLAMKGRAPSDELKQLQHPYQVEEYSVSGLEGDRCVVIINNKIKD
jgi:16S rRNA (guanine527-N7)-methyltransferase